MKREERIRPAGGNAQRIALRHTSACPYRAAITEIITHESDPPRPPRPPRPPKAPKPAAEPSVRIEKTPDPDKGNAGVSIKIDKDGACIGPQRDMSARRQNFTLFTSRV